MIFFLIWALFAYNLYNQYVRGKNKERRVSVRTEFEMPAQHLVDSGYLIPGKIIRQGFLSLHTAGLMTRTRNSL
ncbi:hypothetical protein B7C51_15510 [Paenibacillus larvae subsp. pulvifaciens]|uniref:Uncharacterized protein n=1 Tax=Paenibacillus larvae subsp. pulvifaciens TaxID=1477 RepID=A0A1V0UV30_9BACL|nr:hypothetical protein B7C51_15510 [Paenibacillus larvae subsp. pulvifaciens]